MALSLSSAFSLYTPHTFSRSSSKPTNHLSPKFTRFISTENPLSRTPFSSHPVLNSYRNLNDDVYRNHRRSPSVSPRQQNQHQQFSVPQTAAEETDASSLKSLMHVYKEAVLIGDERTVYEVEDVIYVLEKEKSELSQKVLDLSAEVSSGKEKQLRVQADFDNYRKRVEKERLGVRNDARGEVIESLLPMVDSFERAKQQLKLETEMEKKIDTSYQGIYKQFVEIMRSLQVSAVPTVGKPFDPSLASQNGFRFSFLPLKQPIQRYPRNYGPPHDTIHGSRRHCFLTQSKFYHEPDSRKTCNINKECKKNRKFSRDIVARSELTGSGSAGTSYPLSEIWLNSKVRGICFYAVTAFAAVILFVPMLLEHPFVLVLDRYRRKAHYLVARMWAFFTVAPFIKIEYEGLENLPSVDTPAMYVSNHQSFLDIYALLTLGRSFKFISKTSIFVYPVIGWAMFLLGVIPLRRMDSRSQLDCLKQCITLVKKGASIFFFPEGTRSKDGKLGPFKKGAFSVAAKTGVPVIPITLIGTGVIMPAGNEGILNPGSVKVIVHPSIAGNNPDDLCSEARNVIARGLIIRQG